MTTTIKDIEEKFPQDVEQADENSCGLCHVHEKAYKYFEAERDRKNYDSPFFECPWCGERIPHSDMLSLGHLTVIGESNRGQPDEKMYCAPMDKCPKCDEHFALLPEKIQWNANHDVYYTGGRDYLIDDARDFLKEGLGKRLDEIIRPSVDDYTKRIKAGEHGLDSWNIIYWISGKLEHFVAEELYRRGLKK